MTTEWQHRIIVIVPMAQQATANSLAADLTGNAADTFTFGVSLSADGAEPASHLACFTSATDPIVYGDPNGGTEAAQAGMLGLAELVPGLIWWRLDLTGVLQDTNGEAALGQPFTFADALSELGLQRVRAIEI